MVRPSLSSSGRPLSRDVKIWPPVIAKASLPTVEPAYGVVAAANLLYPQMHTVSSHRRRPDSALFPARAEASPQPGPVAAITGWLPCDR